MFLGIFLASSGRYTTMLETKYNTSETENDRDIEEIFTDQIEDNNKEKTRL